MTTLQNDCHEATPTPNGATNDLRVIRALQRKLQREEVVHLRDLASNLQEQLEQAQREAEINRDCADFWHDAFLQLQETAAGVDVGLTRAGEIVIGQGVAA